MADVVRSKGSRGARSTGLEGTLEVGSVAAEATTPLSCRSSPARSANGRTDRSCSFVTAASDLTCSVAAPPPGDPAAVPAFATSKSAPNLEAGRSVPLVPEPGAADEVERLRAELAQAQHMLREANGKLGEWQALVEEALHTALFNPEANDRYRMHASHMCTAALVALPQVTRVKHVRCSFPSLRREAPTVRLARYTSLESSEWQLSWAPSWSVDVCVEGYHYLYFELTMRISRVSLTGRVRAHFPTPLGAGGVRLAFVRKPKLAMDLESTVSLGLVPVPVQDQIADIVRELMDDWLVQNVVEPKSMLFLPAPNPAHPGGAGRADAGKAGAASCSSESSGPCSPL